VQDVGVDLEESPRAASPATALPLDDSGFAEFALAGTSVCGEFRCSDCRYGAVIRRELPLCPMCGGSIWERRPPLLVD
jgi:hypothetical protein